MAQHWMLRGPGRVFLLFGVVFGGLYWVAKHEWVPLKRIRPTPQQRVEVTAQQPFELEWPRRAEEPKAPALSLLLPIVVLQGGMSDDKLVFDRRASGGQDRFDFFVPFPDPGALSTQALGPRCDARYEAESCYVEQLHVILNQQAPRQEEAGREVMDSKARGSSDAATSGPPRKLKAFWVKDTRETGRPEFVGWDCPGEEPTGTPTTDPALPLLERNRCFEPATVEERRAPKKMGYQRFVRLLACSGNGRDCKVYFPFRGRYVEVAPSDAFRPLARIEEENGHMLLTAWEFLSRLQGDARKPPSPVSRLARGETALENCRKVGGWLKQLEREPGSQRRREEVSRYVRSQCGVAVYYAVATLEQSPVEAARLLAASLATASFNPKRAAGHIRAAIEALEKAGKRESAEMAQAQVALAATFGYSDASSADGRAKRAALKEALRIADAALPPASDTHAAIYRELATVMAAEKEPEKVELMERWQAAMRKARGDTDPLAIEAMQQFCFALHHARQQERLKDCADALLPRWLAAVAVQLDSKFPDVLLSQGTALIGWYAGYGLAQNKPLEVLPTMRQIAAIVQPHIPADVWATYNAPPIKYVEDRARLSGRK